MSNKSSTTSVNLLDRAKQNEPEAWEQMARRYGPLVYRWGREGGLQPEDAADLVQEVFRSLVGAIAQFDVERPDGRFRSWLHGITRHRLQDHFRRVNAEPIGVGGSTANVRLQEVPASPTEESSGRNLVNALALRALRVIEKDFQPNTWQAFWRVAIEGHAPQRVAEDLGMSVASVYQSRSRVLQRLREEMSSPPPSL